MESSPKAEQRTLLNIVGNLGSLVVDRFTIRGWSELPASLDMEVQPLAEVIPLPPRPGQAA